MNISIGNLLTSSLKSNEIFFFRNNVRLKSTNLNRFIDTMEKPLDSTTCNQNY